MRFLELVAKQSQELQSSILANYESSKSPYGKWQGETALLENFNSLPDADRKILKSTVSQTLVVEEEVFANQLSDEAKQLCRDFGMLLWFETAQCYLLPEELLCQLFHRYELVRVLNSHSRADLAELCNTIGQDLPDLNKCRQVQFVAKFYRELSQPLKNATEQKWDELFLHVSPYFQLVERGAQRQWTEFLLRNGMIDEDDIWRGDAASKVLVDSVLSRTIKTAVANGLILIYNHNYQRFVVWNPELREHLLAAKERFVANQLQHFVDDLSPMSKFERGTAGTITSYHFNRHQLFTSAAILSAWMRTDRIGYTQSISFKKTDLRTLAKKLAPRKELENSYVSFLDRLGSQVIRARARSDNWNDYMAYEELWACSVDVLFERLAQGALMSNPVDETVAELLPEKEWVKINDVKRLYLAALTLSIGEMSYVSEKDFEESFTRFLTTFQFFYGRCDVLYRPESEGGGKKKKKYAPFALRMLDDPRSFDVTTCDYENLAMLPNFEVPIPTDISLNSLYKAALFFDVKNGTTLCSGEEHVLRLLGIGKNGKDLKSEFEQHVDGPVPVALLRIMDRSVEDQSKVYVTHGFLYLFDPSDKGRIEKLLSASARSRNKWVDNRVLEFTYNFRAEQFAKKLVKNNFVVEKGFKEYEL